MKLVLNSLFVFMMSFILVSLNCLADEPDAASLSGKLYLQSDDQMAEVDQLLQTAKQKGKLAIIAMGANWCHDSQSFAQKMQHKDVKPLIDQHYELLFVDVGYLDKIKPVITRFQQPVIYATPTVLVIDPESSIQLNQANMHIWRDAYKITTDETVEYFSEIANNRKTMLADIVASKKQTNKRLAQLNQHIATFQQQQADRLYRAFAVIGPMLQQDEQGGSVKNLRKYWKAVAEYRYQFTDDLEQLKKQAHEIAHSIDPKATLDFPKYSAFEWEK
jgi:uncharacterized protein YciI